MVCGVSIIEESEMAKAKKQKNKLDVEIGTRVRYVRETLLGITQEEFAKRLGNDISRGAVGNWELGQGASRKNLTRLSMVFGVDMNWLLTGAGTPKSPTITIQRSDQYPVEDVLRNPRENFLDVNKLDNESSYRETVSVPSVYNPTLKGSLPEIDVRKGGVDREGLGELVMSDAGLKHFVTDEWLLGNDFVNNEAKIRRQESIILSVIGDAMFPNYITGDRVIVDLSQREFMQTAVYAIKDGPDSPPEIRRLTRVRNSEPPRVKIICDNHEYPEEEDVLSNVHILGRVCGIIARR